MSSSHLLTGRELVENGAKKSSVTLPIKGQKQIIASGSWLEKKQIENGLDVKKGLLEDQRIEKRNVLSHADWIEDLQKALVTERKGSQWIHLGHVQDNKLYILPEETLYLMEISALFLKFGGVPVSIQQAYNLLLGKSVSLIEYRVYSALSREGYKLMRHDYNRIYSDANLKDNGCSQNTKLSTNTEAEKELNGVSTKVPMLVSEMQTVASLNDVKSVCNDTNNLNEKSLNQSDETTCNVSGDDDCIVIQVDVENHEDNNRFKRKRVNDIESSVKRMALEKNKNASDVIEVDDLPPFNRLNILDSIVNCYKRNIIYVPAPNSLFIPSRIVLRKKVYIVNLQKVSEVVNNSRTSHFINDYNSNSNVVSTIQRFSGHSRYNNSNHRAEGYQQNNHFLNNTLFFNHIYQQISIRHFNCNMHFERFSCFSNVGNVNFHSNMFMFPRFHNQFNTPRLSHPFTSNRSLVCQNENSNRNNHNLESLGNRRSSNLNPNPFSAAFHRRRHKKNRRSSQGTNSIKPAEVIESDTENTQTIPDSTSSPNTIDDKYTCLLLKVKKILPQCDFGTLNQNNKIRNTLIDAMVQYNSLFNSNYVLNDSLLLHKQITKGSLRVLPSVESTSRDQPEHERIVQLSSDSELSIDSAAELILNSNKNPETSGRSNYVSGQSVSCSHVVSSSDESDVNMSDKNTTNLHSRIKNRGIKKVNTNDIHKNSELCGGWYKQNSWNKPEIASLKPKRNFQILKLTTAFLNSVKKFSRDRESNVQSWKQAKQLYDTKNLQDAVAISDDEDMAENKLPAGLVNTDVAIKIDKVEPLIRPQDCKCVQSVLKKLQIMKPYHTLSDSFSIEEEIKVLYDVYMPTHKNLKKSTPPSPAYSVIVFSHLAPIPSPEKLDAIRLKIPKNVKILFAVVSFDSVFFLQMDNIQLPVI